MGESGLICAATGRVLEIVTHPGESVGQQPLLRLGDTDHMVVMAEVYETQVFEVRPGQRATIVSQALRQPLSGTVDDQPNWNHPVGFMLSAVRMCLLLRSASSSPM